jgi:hypothetical protein
MNGKLLGLVVGLAMLGAMPATASVLTLTYSAPGHHAVFTGDKANIDGLVATNVSNVVYDGWTSQQANYEAPIDQTLIDGLGGGYSSTGLSVVYEWGYYQIQVDAGADSPNIHPITSGSYAVSLLNDNTYVIYSEQGWVWADEYDNGVLYENGFFLFDAGAYDVFTPTSLTVSSTIPEPPTWVIVLLGFAGIGGWRSYAASFRKAGTLSLA